MKKAIIMGEGGHAKVIYSFISKLYNDITFYGPVMEDKIWKEPSKYMEHDFFLGIGDNKIRTKIFKKLKNLNFKMPICYGPNTFVAEDVKVGDGTFVGAGACVMAGAVLGVNVIINTLSSVDHDCIIGNNSQITAGITLGGATIIGENCFLGIKASTVPGVKIGNNVQVMAGSLIVKDVESNLIVGGYPAKTIKYVEEEQL
ncbi:MAG: hypothetical protein K2P81_16315 [Bacteriovoracaceae bacterium]|nr:hypothetical protein [Bacteriovoracaceae bacterium]